MRGDEHDWAVRTRVWVDRGGALLLGPGRVELLEHIDRLHSISAAARRMGMSYRRAWRLVQLTNAAAGEPLVEATTGGPGGGGAVLTERGREAVTFYHAVCARVAEATSGPGDPACPVADRQARS